MPRIVKWLSILPPAGPLLLSFALSLLDLFDFAFANRSSSLLGGTELHLDRDEAVVFRDAKTPEELLTQVFLVYAQLVQSSISKTTIKLNKNKECK